MTNKSRIFKYEGQLYVRAGGWVATPKGESQFSAGDKVKAYHFGGSPTVGVGNKEGRGEYEEYWTIPRSMEYSKFMEKIDKDKIDYGDE